AARVRPPFPTRRSSDLDWEHGYEPALGLPAALALVAGGYLLGWFVTRSVPFVKRMLLSRGRMRSFVTLAAARAFDHYGVKDTKRSEEHTSELQSPDHLV